MKTPAVILTLCLILVLMIAGSAAPSVPIPAGIKAGDNNVKSMDNTPSLDSPVSTDPVFVPPDSGGTSPWYRAPFRNGSTKDTESFYDGYFRRIESEDEIEQSSLYEAYLLRQSDDEEEGTWHRGFFRPEEGRIVLPDEVESMVRGQALTRAIEREGQIPFDHLTREAPPLPDDELAADAVPAAPIPFDQVILDDLIVDGSLCVGMDCVNGESFGFDTIRLKENNLRIRFVDTSSTSSFPSRDWQITINDSNNGGANKFSIDDIDGGRTPFTIEAGAPSHSIYVDDGGRIGFGTSTPVAQMHQKDGNTPTLRLEQDGSSGFSPQTWDVAGNEANFFIRDATNGSTLPFRLRPGAPTSTIDISGDGEVGLGTDSPWAPLHVRNTMTPQVVIDQDGSSYFSTSVSSSGVTSFEASASTGVTPQFLFRNDVEFMEDILFKTSDTWIRFTGALSGIEFPDGTTQTTAGGGGGTSHHGSLTGLVNDDHNQYALLAGRTGGQVLTGGTGTGNDLTLRSTSHTTKGDIILADNGGRVGVGTASPSAKLSVYGGSIFVGSNLHASDGGINVDGIITFGWGTGVSTPSTGQMVIYHESNSGGSLRFKTPSVDAMTIQTNGNVGTGTTSPAARAHIISATEQLRVGYDTSNYYSTTVSSAGVVTFDAAGASSAFTFNDGVTPGSDAALDLGSSGKQWRDIYSQNAVTVSDERHKENITPSEYGLQEVLQLNPVSFTWRNGDPADVEIGLTAQEVFPIIPEVVNIGDDSLQTMGLSYHAVVPVLITAIQEQQAIIEQQNDQISGLLEQSNQLATRIDEIIRSMNERD